MMNAISNTARRLMAWGVAPLWVSMVIPAYADTVEYIHTDALGTPIAVTDASGNVIQTSEYAPYGELLNRTVTDGPGFTGHVSDAATGLTALLRPAVRVLPFG